MLTIKHTYRWLATAVIMTILPLTAGAQALTTSDNLYKELVLMRADTAVTQPQLYAKAMDCSRVYLMMLQATPRGIPAYKREQEILKEIYPFVQNGAGYYQRQHNDSAAVAFGRAAVDIAMMSEMRDQGLRQAAHYPNLVYFVAARTYNSGNMADAVRYLQEYIDVTDASQHGRVLAFLEEARLAARQQQKSSDLLKEYNRGVPDFDAFAKEAITASMEKWKQKDPYETVAEFKERVNEEKAREKQRELQKVLMDEYVQRFSHQVSVADMALKPYDADNESFLINSPYGDIVLTVPRDNNEARDFADHWTDVKVYNQNFIIANKKLALAGLTFSTPSGKTYNYSNRQALAYNETHIDANFTDLVDVAALVNSDSQHKTAAIGRKEVVVGVSDVDINIPQSKHKNDNTFAVIIANEKYTLVPQVPMAGNDGAVFAKYCEQTLGLPKENILQYPDATFGKMIRAMQDIKNIADAYRDINVIFYYAGHGIPNESTRDAFLLPIDADGTTTEVCYPLKKLYTELTAMGVRSVVVFIDACFSGANGEGGTLMASARGVAIKPHQEQPTGTNMVVFSAATDDETAYPYKERNHGLFTYFLLKRLQESKGNTTLGELGKYITDNVKQKSVLINRKSQTPTVTASVTMGETWKKMKLK